MININKKLLILFMLAFVILVSLDLIYYLNVIDENIVLFLKISCVYITACIFVLSGKKRIIAITFYIAYLLLYMHLEGKNEVNYFLEKAYFGVSGMASWTMLIKYIKEFE
ncbi:hypothetical protein SAMN02745245_01131 [Anaerosphaera aminiphila DSM 21120]|uniref:Uncharacterized protein n=1 Tax=Anaerosphaera aminiphila DSM 21120 TaxID=1120995 RepID=A0A1M5SB02_9FIRM|nr:hypothetical protein [Anaerosphaera aminiphila]SHH35676.1 hypothetical protein SAMN02745245_01131 [Anaerosphaera aminiphila DSM 21120]